MTEKAISGQQKKHDPQLRFPPYNSYDLVSTARLKIANFEEEPIISSLFVRHLFKLGSAFQFALPAILITPWQNIGREFSLSAVRFKTLISRDRFLWGLRTDEHISKYRDM